LIGQAVRAYIMEIHLKTGLIASSVSQGHSRSPELTRIDRVPVTFYECSIAIMGLSRTVSKMLQDI